MQSCEPEGEFNCEDTGCLNGGDCIGGDCFCPAGFEGVDCADLSREKFLNLYASSGDDCTGSNYSMEIITDASSNIEINLKNLGNFGQNTSVNAVMTGETSFSIPAQTVSGLSSVDVEGEGSLSGTLLTVSYVKTIAGTPTSCNATYQAQ